MTVSEWWSPQVSSIKSIWITTQTPDASKTVHLSCGISLLLLLLPPPPSPPLYSGVTQRRVTLLSSSQAKTATETYQHFCLVRTNCNLKQLHVCLFGVWLGFYFSCPCFHRQLSFITVGLNEDQADSETREHCRIGFLCRNLTWRPSGIGLALSRYSWLNIFNSLMLFNVFSIIQCHSVLVGLKSQFSKAEMSYKGILILNSMTCPPSRNTFLIRCWLCCRLLSQGLKKLFSAFSIMSHETNVKLSS